MRLRLCIAIVAVAFAGRGDAAPCRRGHAADRRRSRTRTSRPRRSLLKQKALVHAGGTRRDDGAALGGAVDDLDLVQALLRAGATNAANRYGSTPLELAAVNGNAARHRGAAAGWRRCRKRDAPKARPC